jgi:hypothetical protein
MSTYTTMAEVRPAFPEILEQVQWAEGKTHGTENQIRCAFNGAVMGLDGRALVNILLFDRKGLRRSELDFYVDNGKVVPFFAQRRVTSRNPGVLFNFLILGVIPGVLREDFPSLWVNITVTGNDDCLRPGYYGRYCLQGYNGDYSGIRNVHPYHQTLWSQAISAGMHNSFKELRAPRWPFVITGPRIEYDFKEHTVSLKCFAFTRRVKDLRVIPDDVKRTPKDLSVFPPIHEVMSHVMGQSSNGFVYIEPSENALAERWLDPGVGVLFTDDVSYVMT